GLVGVETARSQALVGFCNQQRVALKNLAVEMDTPFCAITLSSLDGQAIGQAGRLLLTVTGRAENSGMAWNAKRISLEDWGKAPARIEVVKGKVLLKGLQGAQAVLAQALDAAGQGQGAGTRISCAATDGGWTLPVGQAATTWYAITVRR
ncbi:MAG TPA: hypothetical protein VNT26_03090, partial [Candidatus Sulfotelmatobacter sp.]|nr:hypothetical protein [Candidatus Sulfotelmatobacter sp.]